MALTLPSPSSVRTAVDNTKAHNKPLDEFPRSMTCRPPHRQSSCGQLKAKSSSQSHPHEATFEWATDQRPERLHRLQDGGHNGSATTRVPVYVMLPLDTVSPNGGRLTRTRALNASLMALRSAGVEGVMVDVWWGLVEKDGPLRYNWGSYNELVKMVARHGLKLQMVMSFHQCGGNVGDSCRLLESNLRGSALGIYNDSAYSQILTTSRSDAGSGLSAFTYLRMKKNMFEGENWRQFVAFVKRMNEGGRSVMPSKGDSSHSDLYVGFITNKNQNMKAGVAI